MATLVKEVNNKKSCAFLQPKLYVSAMSLGDRISALLDEKGWSQAELARRVGVSTQSIWKLVKGEAAGSRNLHKIARELGTTAEFLTGEIDDPAPAPGSAMIVAPVEPNPDEVEIDWIDLAYGMGGTFLDSDNVRVEKARFSRAWLRVFTSTPPNLLFSTQGYGDSMMPTIHDRDVVIIDRSQRTPDMGDKIWAIVYAGMGMIKRLRYLPDGTVKISSDNHLIRDEIATDADLHIVGRVIAVMRAV